MGWGEKREGGRESREKGERKQRDRIGERRQTRAGRAERLDGKSREAGLEKLIN